MSNTAPVSAETQDHDETQQVLFVDQGLDPSFDEVAFDEMNLTELPFALLTRNTTGIYDIPLSADGKSRLACLNSLEHGLPNSLAPRVLLGLMWMWKSQCRSGEQTFLVRVRDLIVHYMHPDRFKMYAPNSDTLRAVERQINCIANSRIHTDRWWDHKLKRHQKANIAIISDVTVVEEGGPCRARVLQVTWGKPFLESMLRRYTKPIDARLVQRLEHPIDLQLYRLLDRQLALKQQQRYANIVDFARYKLGMQGKTLDGGGRTASSYVAKKLREALQRLSSEQFTVRMTIDRRTEPSAVTFERLEDLAPGQGHEVVDHDRAAELVREFFLYAHGVPREQTTCIEESHRTAAKKWLHAYGLEKAKWMIQHCVKMQKVRGGEKILVFKGLQRYEASASGAYERHRAEEADRKERQFSEELARCWNTYRTKLVDLFDESASAEELASLEAELRESLQREKPDTPGNIVDLLLRARLYDLKCDKMTTLSMDEFRAHRSLETLRAAIIERHDLDLLAPPSGGTEGQGAPQAAA